MDTVWLLLIVFGPALAIIFLRVNAVFVYLALCLGYVLSQFDGSNGAVDKVITSNRFDRYLGGANDLHLILLLLPPVIVLLVMLKTAGAKKYSANSVAAITVGLLLALTAIPLLPISTALSIMKGSLWNDLLKYEEPIVALSTLLILVLLILQRSKLGGGGKHSKHGKD